MISSAIAAQPWGLAGPVMLRFTASYPGNSVAALAAYSANSSIHDAAQSAFWLSELRPGAPESADCHILFTVEPSGSAMLLAAGMENDWLHAWYAEAIAVCRIRYQRERVTMRKP